jgi:hypothetical protein
LVLNLAFFVLSLGFIFVLTYPFRQPTKQANSY